MRQKYSKFNPTAPINHIIGNSDDLERVFEIADITVILQLSYCSCRMAWLRQIDEATYAGSETAAVGYRKKKAAVGTKWDL